MNFIVLVHQVYLVGRRFNVGLGKSEYMRSLLLQMLMNSIGVGIETSNVAKMHFVVLVGVGCSTNRSKSSFLLFVLHIGYKIVTHWWCK